MRLGGPLYGDTLTPQLWAQTAQQFGYRALYCPVKLGAPDDEIRAYAQAARDHDLLIAEVGAWSNPLDPDPVKAAAALEKCKKSLDLADRVGARSCVNISGSRGEIWDGPHPLNFSSETFEMIVAYVREIVDEVRPTRAFYALETMPWMYPDSADSYLALLQAIDRPQVAVHLDPVNLICSPQRFYDNAGLIRDCFQKLGPHIKGCHAKDIALSSKLTTHLDEVRPGLGGLDYRVLLGEMAKLDADTPMMLEHLPSQGEYEAAASYLRAVADELDIAL